MDGIYNVLSVDWDYFSDATLSQRLRLFPDRGNENLGSLLSNIIWGTRYVSGELVQTGLDKRALSVLTSVLRKASPDCLMMVADSHKYAYDFILDSMEEDCVSHINLVNIDFHHDLYDLGDSNLNCGNWLRLLMEDYDSEYDKFSWVKREDSDTDGVDLSRLQVVPIESIKGIEWDLIFICRSNVWSPPHLDKHFKKAFYPIAHRNMALVEDRIFDSRYPEVSLMARRQKKIMEENHIPV